ncbi:hypothetical protein [Candidatus Tisiphia endosymbiont of Beris chalybata]
MTTQKKGFATMNKKSLHETAHKGGKASQKKQSHTNSSAKKDDSDQ